jgi:hypothetical protein
VYVVFGRLVVPDGRLRVGLYDIMRLGVLVLHSPVSARDLGPRTLVTVADP